MTHIRVSKLTIVGSDNGFSPDRCQAIIWTNAGIFKKMDLRMSYGKWRPCCLGLNVSKLVCFGAKLTDCTNVVKWEIPAVRLVITSSDISKFRQFIKRISVIIKCYRGDCHDIARETHLFGNQNHNSEDGMYAFRKHVWLCPIKLTPGRKYC